MVAFYISQLINKLAREEEALRDYNTVAIALDNEVAEVRRRNSLTDFERTMEDLRKKGTLAGQEFELKMNRIKEEVIRIVPVSKVRLSLLPTSSLMVL